MLGLSWKIKLWAGTFLSEHIVNVCLYILEIPWSNFDANGPDGIHSHLNIHKTKHGFMTRCITGQDLLINIRHEKQILLDSNTEWHLFYLRKPSLTKYGINSSQLMVLLFRDICKNTLKNF